MELQRHLADVRAHGAALVAISTEPVAATVRAARSLHIAFPLLQDTGHRVGLAFGVFDGSVVAADRDTLLVLDGNGHVRWRRPTGDVAVPSAGVIAALERG